LNYQLVKKVEKMPFTISVERVPWGNVIVKLNSSKIVSQFLTEMDGFSHNNQDVLILGATNVPWALDSAFRRPGRFDRVLFVPPPDKDARKLILELILKDKPIDEDINYDGIVKKTVGFSGADLNNLVETACDIAIENTLDTNKEQNITNHILKDALYRCLVSFEISNVLKSLVRLNV